MIGDQTNGQDQRSKREHVHRFRGRVESLCLGVEKLGCLVDKRPLDLDIPSAGKNHPSTCLGVDGDIRNRNISVVGDEDVVLFGQAQSMEAKTSLGKTDTYGVDVAMDHVVGVHVLDCLGCLDELQMPFEFQVKFALRFKKVGLTSFNRETSG